MVEQAPSERNLSEVLPKIDIHLHLAGSGCGGSGCVLHPALRKRYTIRILQFIHKLSTRQTDEDLDQVWGEMISRVIEESEVDYGVALGFDGAADHNGKRDPTRTQLIVPPDWVFELCKRYHCLLPGPSVNPHLADAEETLDYCIENKAVLIKWLPSAQLINPAERKIRGYYRKLADSGIPLLIHCGGERTFHSYRPEWNQAELLRFPLEAGVRVICAHSATRVHGSSEENQLPALIRLLREFPDLWVDNSGLCNPSRFMHLPQLAKHPLICERTLYGSDWPVPANAFYYLPQMGFSLVRKLEKLTNPLNRDIRIKAFFGYPPASLTRASRVLANLEHWIRPLKRTAT